MATLQEYYLNDFPRLFSYQTEWAFRNDAGVEFKVTVKIHFDFDASVSFISFYIPNLEDEVNLFTILLERYEEVLKMGNNILIKQKLPGEIETSSSDLKFSGKIFFYFEGEVNKDKFIEMKNKSKQDGIFIHYRDLNFSKERSKIEKPIAFISHDSRDKEIARKIAEELQKRMCPVWYDEYSLRLGDNLRESIEKGLKECKKCILILSPNFLGNLGWTKTEFNTIFTREIIEKSNLVLPIWAGATREEIYEYSPILVDRVGINWDKGAEIVISKIHQAVII